VGYFGVKSTNVCRDKMGTKPAKVGRLAPGVLKCGAASCAASTPHPRAPPQKGLPIHAASKVAKVGAAGGPKLLKWGRLRATARQGQIC